MVRIKRNVEINNYMPVIVSAHRNTSFTDGHSNVYHVGETGLLILIIEWLADSVPSITMKHLVCQLSTRNRFARRSPLCLVGSDIICNCEV